MCKSRIGKGAWMLQSTVLAAILLATTRSGCPAAAVGEPSLAAEQAAAGDDDKQLVKNIHITSVRGTG